MMLNTDGHSCNGAREVKPASEAHSDVYHAVSVNSNGAREVKPASEVHSDAYHAVSVTSNERNKYKTPLIDDGYKDFSDLDTGRAWVVLFASFCISFLVGNSVYTCGIVQLALLERYGESISLTSWTGALHSSFSLLAGPVSSAIINRFSCRTALVLAGVLYVIGLLATAVAPNIEVAILTFGIIAGIGGGLAYTASLVVVGFYFKRRRNLALGIASSGIGAGLFALAPLLQMYRAEYGTTGFFVFSAGVMAHVIVFGMLCRPSQLEKHTQMKLQSKDAEKPISDSSSVKFIPKRLDNSVTHVLLNKGVLCLCVAHLLYALGSCLVYFHLPTYMTANGLSVVQAAYFLSLTGIMNLVGRLLAGAIANHKHVHELVVFAGSMLINALATLLYPFTSENLPGHVIFATTFGLFYGCYCVVTTTVSMRLLDIQFVPTAVGVQFMFGGVGALVGPVLAGLIVDYGGSYQQTFILAGFCSMLASLVSATSACFQSVPPVKSIEMKV